MICVICKKKAKWRFSPDLDINGVGACKKHKGDVQMAYIALVTSLDDKLYFSMIEGHKDYKKD